MDGPCRVELDVVPQCHVKTHKKKQIMPAHFIGKVQDLTHSIADGASAGFQRIGLCVL